jgi:glycosyltransferase involved in cell wall biosynthesis
MKSISYIICSHRAPDTLLQTIDSIVAQDCFQASEIVLVNNGFPEQRELALQERGRGALVCVRESVPGLGFARRRGFQAASGRYFVLLDDDNYLSPCFTIQLLDSVELSADIGGICPLVEPVWEHEPEQWLQDFGRLCLSYNTAGPFRPPFEERFWGRDDTQERLRPPGGGMIIRRDVAQHYLHSVRDPKRITLARQPDSLVGCEDEDIFSGVAELGLSLYFNAQLKVFHQIPATRTTFSYLFKLNFQMLYSYGVLERIKRERGFSLMGELGLMIREVLSLSRTVSLGKMPVKRGVLEMTRAVGLFKGRTGW